MSISFIVSQVFGLLASILYLWIFLFILHNVLIRLTRFKSRLSKAVSSTLFICFTGTLFIWMGSIGFGSSKFVLPSHLFLLGMTWMEYYQGNKLDQSNVE